MNTRDVRRFKKWLINRGAEILPPTNEYEVLRFKGKEVGVVYTTGKTSNSYTNKAIVAWRTNKRWSGKPFKVGRKKTYTKEKIAIQKRDGCNCFYCGKPLGDDITLEHLISLVQGGKNTLGNMVLAHEKCNQEAGNLTVIEKVNLAILKRQKQ